MSNEVVPGILEKNWEEIERKLEIFRKFAKTIHIDFIDGKFANNLTFLDTVPFSKYSKDVFFEAHLMVEEPLQYLSPLAESGFKRFLGQVEKMGNQEEFVAQGQILGEVGLALNLDTPLDAIKVPLDDLDVVLLLSVDSNFSGQEFQESSIGKIKNLRQRTQIPIEVDGGINDKTIAECKNAGATRFVSTSFISNFPDPEAAFKTISGLV